MKTSRATHWRLRQQTLNLGPLPVLMGIVNVTPDSFSDGGRWLKPETAVKHGLQLVEEGAGILDIGGESTRPYSEPVAADEQIRRVVPVIEALRRATTVPISIDTSSAEVAAAAIGAGAELVNDVTGLQGDPEMPALCRDTGVGVCVMHMQGTPQTMQDAPQYRDCVGEIADYLQTRKAELEEWGIESDRICLDPGIGFGKTHEHNLELLRNAERFLELGAPILIGHSRKGFVGKVLGDSARDRDAGTLGVSLRMAMAGIPLLRVHEVGRTREALLLFAAAGGLPL